MDKYQINFLKDIEIKLENNEGCGSFEIDDDGNLTIVQNENYNITNYILKISNKDFSSVSYYVNAWKKANVDNGSVCIPFDFNNPLTIIKIEFKNGFVDDFDIKVSTKTADKNLWDVKHAKEVKERRLNNVEAVLNSVDSLHTIIFKQCCDKYAYTIVKWYAVSKIKPKTVIHAVGVGASYPAKTPSMTNTFLEECKVTDKFYCNIECAFNVAVEITQYDKNGNELISLSVN